MKFLYKTMYSALLMGAMGLNATAQQQLPNWGFEEDWVTCNPWTGPNGATKSTGQNPKDWCISNVAGMKVPIFGWQGDTQVGSKVGGYNSVSAVNIANTPNSSTFAKDQIVPGYVTLGTTWSTAKGTSAENKDGGSWGGYKFSDRPTGIEFMYKRTDNAQNTASSIIAYLWTGTYTQANVPLNIATNPTIGTMTNRDRNILEIPTEQGGSIDKTPGAECIATINENISGETSEWTSYSAKFNYTSDATPEMINVIFSAGDYFAEASAVKKDVNLTIDNVRVFYEHEGDLKITIAENSANSEATIKIIPNGDGTCTFSLPNFTLKGETEDEDMPIGDIIVNDVKITEQNGSYYYEGSVEKMELLGGMIKANVSLSGTVENMKINVIWLVNPDDINDPNNTPIYVEFAKKPDTPTGITDITVDNIDNSNAPVEFFNLQGVRVAADNLTPGIYVRRQGSKVSKVLVK